MSVRETVPVGTKVCVVRPISDMEKTLVGRVFRFVRWDDTHGYAVVGDEHGNWHLHPEALLFDMESARKVLGIYTSTSKEA